MLMLVVQACDVGRRKPKFCPRNFAGLSLHVHYGAYKFEDEPQNFHRRCFMLRSIVEGDILFITSIQIKESAARMGGSYPGFCRMPLGGWNRHQPRLGGPLMLLPRNKEQRGWPEHKAQDSLPLANHNIIRRRNCGIKPRNFNASATGAA